MTESNSMRMSAISTALILLACGDGKAGGRTPPDSGRATPGAGLPSSADSATVLTDRAWIRSDSTGLPGVMRIFLPDGTLLMDSCWETYRLAKWKRGSGQQISWNEDGTDIRATVLSVSDRDLTLRLNLPGGAEEQSYTRAATPYVCPEMKR